MPKITVYFRGLIEKIRLGFLCSENKEFKKEKLRSFVKNNADIIIIYFIGILTSIVLTHYHTLILGIIGTLVFGSIFLYDAINHDGKYSLYCIFDYPKNIKVLMLVGYLLIESIICILININNFLNI